jgi:hypothetical protein
MDAKREHSTGRSTRRKTFPLLGGAILLLSFSTQNFSHDRRNSQMKALETAMSDRALVR